VFAFGRYPHPVTEHGGAWEFCPPAHRIVGSGLFDGWWVCINVPNPPLATSFFTWTTTLLGGPEPTLVSNYTPTTFPTADANFDPQPTQAGIISGCLAYYQAQEGDTCREIIGDGTYLSQEEFFSFNPALNGNCDGLWLDYWYCVVGPDGITGMPPTANSTPFFVPPGQISTCEKWYQREAGESCADIANGFGTFSEQDFGCGIPRFGALGRVNRVEDSWMASGIVWVCREHQQQGRRRWRRWSFPIRRRLTRVWWGIVLVCGLLGREFFFLFILSVSCTWFQLHISGLDTS